MAGNEPSIKKVEYEYKLAHYLWGLFIANTIFFVIGKIIGYFDFLSWWWIFSPLIIGFIGAFVNYLDWVPESRILLFTIGFPYMVLRYAILTLILWMPIFTSLFTGFCIIIKYGEHSHKVLIAIFSTIVTYFLTTKLTGKNLGLPK